MTDTQIRRIILFSGSVQGVGFRYTVQTIAQSHPVTGYVKNLANGRVELVVEGGTKEVDAFQQAIEKAMTPNISEVNIVDRASTGELSSFRIRH